MVHQFTKYTNILSFQYFFTYTQQIRIFTPHKILQVIQLVIIKIGLVFIGDLLNITCVFSSVFYLYLVLRLPKQLVSYNYKFWFERGCLNPSNSFSPCLFCCCLRSYSLLILPVQTSSNPYIQEAILGWRAPNNGVIFEGFDTS